MTKVLFVYSGNAGSISPFIKDQANALGKNGVEVSFYPIIGKGIFGYLKNIFGLRKQIEKNNIDIIHAHYGLSGLVATLQNKKPVVTTFHGSDINNKKVRPISKLTAKRSDASIFVSEKLRSLAGMPINSIVIPCGVDLEIFKENRMENKEEFRVLFSSSFDRIEKNYPLAKEAIGIVERKLGKNIKLIELKGYNRIEVSDLLKKVNLALLTSFMEGSPQFIKETMSCGCPAVATDVGDVKQLFGEVPGYYIAQFCPEDVAKKILMAIKFSRRNRITNGRKRIKNLGLDSENVTKRIINVYKSVLDKK